MLYFTKTRLYKIQDEQKYFIESIWLESISGGHPVNLVLERGSTLNSNRYGYLIIKTKSQE